MIKFWNMGAIRKDRHPFGLSLIKFSLIICGLFVFSCGEEIMEDTHIEKSFTWEAIPFVQSLSGRKYSIEKLNMPSRLFYKANKLVVLDDAIGYNFFHLFEGKSLAYLHSSGALGFGPGETPDAWSIDSGFDSTTFWVHSLGGKIFSEYALNISDDPKALRQIKQEGELFRAMGITWGSDSTLITFLADGHEKFVEFHLDGKKLNGFGTWQGMIAGTHEDHVIADLHQGVLVGDAVSGKFIKACIFRDRLEIFDRQNETIIGVNGPENFIPEFRTVGAGVVTSSDYPLAYMDVFLGKEFIFGLYSGKTDREIMVEGRGESELLVFNYLGDVKALFKLEIPISGFTVDEDGKRIFGITTDKDPGVAVFSFRLE